MREHSGHENLLPPFTVRYHHAARRVRLRVTARDGLVVTLPPGVSHAVAAEAVEQNVDWAQQLLERTASRRALYQAGPDALLPSQVALRLTGTELTVSYRETSSTRCTARDDDGVLVVSGSVQDADACLRAIRRWRDRTAERLLPPLLDEVSKQSGTRVARLTLRTQRSRWGSCSSRGAISLNRNLVFLSDELVRYVVTHEVAHVRHANHSPAFWAHLDSLDPRSREKRRLLRQARDLVPPWAEA